MSILVHEVFLQLFTTVIGINDLLKLVKTQLLKKQYFSFRNNFAQIHDTEKKSKIKDKVQFQINILD